MSEKVILKHFLDSRDSFEQYGPNILAIKNLDREVRVVLNLITKYYNTYKVKGIGAEELKVFYKKLHQTKMTQDIETYLADIFKVNVTNKDLTLDLIEATIERHTASKILDKLALVIEGGKTKYIHTIQDDIDDYISTLRNPPSNIIAPFKLDLDELIKKEIKEIGLPFVSPTMNKEIRGAKGGTIGLIFAYVGVGKTSFATKNIANMAHHIATKEPWDTRPLVYGCNEEAQQRVALRIIQGLTGYDSKQIAAQPKLVKKALTMNGYDRIEIIDQVTHLRTVRRILEKYGPRVMFIDQGTKVKVWGQKERDVQTLEALFNTYREWGKEFDCAFICCAQADGECRDKEYLQKDDLYFSKVGIPGELDWMVGVGLPEDDNYATWRRFNICKNKFGEEDVRFSMRFNKYSNQFKEVT